jgi:hypothetical protein
MRITAENIQSTAQISARFTDAKPSDKVTLEIKSLSGSV